MLDPSGTEALPLQTANDVDCPPDCDNGLGGDGGDSSCDGGCGGVPDPDPSTPSPSDPDGDLPASNFGPGTIAWPWDWPWNWTWDFPAIPAPPPLIGVLIGWEIGWSLGGGEPVKKPSLPLSGPLQKKGGGGRKGERGWTRKPSKPGKGARQDPITKRWWVRNPHTGKPILKPPTWEAGAGVVDASQRWRSGTRCRPRLCYFEGGS
jgi:hypothetical protein